MMPTRHLSVLRLGQVRYADAHTLQRHLCDEVASGRIASDLLLLLEHEPTVTLGRGTQPDSLPVSREELAHRGLTVVEVERGGDVTWHGPGQLVGYPILNLSEHRQDLHWYLRQVEEALLVALGTLSISAKRNPGFTGVWTEERKIASIGIHVRQWVTTHGFALNVTNSLDQFSLIVPCGIAGVQMTSVARELGSEATGRRGDGAALWDLSLEAVIAGFAQVFELMPEDRELAELVRGVSIPGPVSPAER